MGKTYAGNTSDESAIPKKIYVGNDSNLSVPCKVAYCGDGNGQAVEVYRNTTLPSAYQKVEYIYDTNGTEYINPGIKPNSGTRIFIDFLVQRWYDAVSFIGLNQSGADNYAALSFSSDNPYFKYYWGNSNGQTKASATQRHTYDINKNFRGSTYFDNKLLINSTNTFSSSAYDYLIFATMQSSGTVFIAQGVRYNLYAFKVWQDGIMIRDMYPCYLKSDSQVVGMYDLIGNQFYDNSGTGIFYKGPDVN